MLAQNFEVVQARNEVENELEALRGTVRDIHITDMAVFATSNGQGTPAVSVVGDLGQVIVAKLKKRPDGGQIWKVEYKGDDESRSKSERKIIRDTLARSLKKSTKYPVRLEKIS